MLIFDDLSDTTGQRKSLLVAAKSKDTRNWGD